MHQSKPSVCVDPRLQVVIRSIYHYMGIKDLFAWSALSIFYYYDIESYCKYICLRFKLKERVKVLYLHLKDNSNFEKDFLSVECKYKWLYMTWVKLNSIFRVFITQSHIRELESPCYILTQFDRHLKRHTVELKNVKKVHVVVEFPKVPAGTYSIRLRVNIDSIYWPNDEKIPTKMRVTWETINEKETILNEEFALIVDWESLCEMFGDAEQPHQNNGLSTRIHDTGNGWVDLSLDSFTLKNESDVIFELKDLKNAHWKSGIVFDYVELKRIDWYA